MARHWSKKESQALLLGVGVYGLGWFRTAGGRAHSWPNAEKKRTSKAVYCKARRLFGTGGITRGAYSLLRITKMTGYSKSHIRRAMRALAQKWKRTSVGRGNYLVYEEQVDEIVGWLQKDYWSKVHRLYNCIWCHREDTVHEGQGLCRECYKKYAKRLRRAEFPLKCYDTLQEFRQLVSVEDRDSLALKALSNLKRGRAMPEAVFGEWL